MEKYKDRILEILSNSNLNVITSKSIRKLLEQEHNVDLSSVKKQLDEFILDLLDSLHKESESEQAEEDIVETDEESIDLSTDAQLAQKLHQELNPPSRHKSKPKPHQVKRKSPVKRETAFTRPLFLSNALSAFFNETQLARTEVVKRLWQYIKEKDLQGN